MDISVAQAGGRFRLQFDTTAVTLGRGDVIQLALAIDEAMLPAQGKRKELVDVQSCRIVVDRLRHANDEGMRILLRELAPRNLQMILRLAKENPSLLRKLEHNLSKRAYARLVEDVAVRFAKRVPIAEMREAMDELTSLVQRLELDGVLHFRGAEDQMVSL